LRLIHEAEQAVVDRAAQIPQQLQSGNGVAERLPCAEMGVHLRGESLHIGRTRLLGTGPGIPEIWIEFLNIFCGG
jgi:hypothetical protein